MQCVALLLNHGSVLITACLVAVGQDLHRTLIVEYSTPHTAIPDYCRCGSDAEPRNIDAGGRGMGMRLCVQPLGKDKA